MKLIGVCGHTGTGKTTIIKEALGLAPALSQVNIASDPIVKMLRALGVPRAALYNKAVWGHPEHYALGGKTIREAAVSLGAWGRELHEDMWLTQAFRQADIYGGVVLIDGVRWPREAQMIQQADGVMISFHREGHEYWNAKEGDQNVATLQWDCEHSFMNTNGSITNEALRFIRMLRERELL